MLRVKLKERSKKYLVKYLMGYQFHGFFSNGDEGVIAVARDQWPFCIVKPIVMPFRGFGLIIPEMHNALSNDEYERHLESVAAVEEKLVTFSCDFPRSTFVYLEADCFGGVCLYSGYVSQAGKVHLKISPESAKEGTESLRQLMAALGIDLGDGYFAPLTRGYWSSASI